MAVQPMIPIITAVTANYFPGLIALRNSLVANAGIDYKLHCIVFGDEALTERIEAAGVTAIPDPQWSARYPTSERWPEPVPSSFSRLYVPRLFPDCERAIWLDSDCVVVRSLEPLTQMRFAQPVATVFINNERYELLFNVTNLPPELHRIRATFNGLLVYNIAEWNRQGITERCREVMEADTDLIFRYIDQSVLSYVLRGNFHRLGLEWQHFANRKTEISPAARVLHWVGGKGNAPWLLEMNHASIWRQYHEAAPERVDGGGAP